jgi:hypothetical protein
LITDDPNQEEVNEDTFADAFGDLKVENLPEYFVTPGRNSLPDYDDDDVQDIFAISTAERLKDQESDMVQQPPLTMPSFGSPYGNKSATKPPPGLPPGLTPKSTIKKEGTGADSNASLLSPALSRVTPSNPPGLIPSPFITRSEGLFPASSDPQTPVTANKVSVVSAILSPPPPPPLLTPKHPIDGKNNENNSTPASAAPFFTAPKPNFGRGKCMSVGDVRFVVTKVLQPLETLDPYADDFYFIQYTIKKNILEREKSMKEQKAPPPPVNVPLPTWKDTKERIKSQIAVSRQNFHEKTKEWESKEGVLGHRVRADVARPRELLTLPSLGDLDFDLNDEDGKRLLVFFFSISYFILFLFCSQRWNGKLLSTHVFGRLV